MLKSNLSGFGTSLNSKIAVQTMMNLYIEMVADKIIEDRIKDIYTDQQWLVEEVCKENTDYKLIIDGLQDQRGGDAWLFKGTEVKSGTQAQREQQRADGGADATGARLKKPVSRSPGRLAVVSTAAVLFSTGIGAEESLDDKRSAGSSLDKAGDWVESVGGSRASSLDRTPTSTSTAGEQIVALLNTAARHINTNAKAINDIVDKGLTPDDKATVKAHVTKPLARARLSRVDKDYDSPEVNKLVSNLNEVCRSMDGPVEGMSHGGVRGR
ncbi:MAG: hypothetical protein HON23_05985 [Rickettsiales bacterium]|nr:hypothetical protein [Rickettsiales bacterium]